MKSLYELVAPYDSVSLIGMCKNAGKTTTLNQLIAELKRNGVSFGATSVGRDGESTDLVTNTVKPGIFVYKGTIVATAADLLKYCDTKRGRFYVLPGFIHRWDRLLSSGPGQTGLCRLPDHP